MYCIKIVFVVGMKKSTRTRRAYVEIYCNILRAVLHDMSIQKKLIFRCEFLPFSVWHIYLCIMKKNWYCMIHTIYSFKKDKIIVRFYPNEPTIYGILSQER